MFRRDLPTTGRLFSTDEVFLSVFLSVVAAFCKYFFVFFEEFHQDYFQGFVSVWRRRARESKQDEQKGRRNEMKNNI